MSTRVAAPRRGSRRPAVAPAAEQHAEWLNLLRPDGPFIALTVLADALKQGLDAIPAETMARLRQAWLEVQAAPDLLRPAWVDLVLTELLRWPPGVLADDARLPNELRSWGGGQARPDAVVSGPDILPGSASGRAERLLVYLRPWDEPLTRATREQPALTEQAAQLCRRRGVPLALLTNGRLWALVHAKQGGPTSVAVFDADLWLEEPSLLRAFATLLGAPRLLPPPVRPDGAPSDSLAGLFERTANAQTQIVDTLGGQVRQAVELLVGEFARLDRESGGALLAEVPERQIYRAALTVMMRLVFLLYAEELHRSRGEIMRCRRIELTDLYNLVNDASIRADDIQRIRGLHVEIDDAVRQAYGFDEQRDPMICEFERKKATVPLPAWSEIDLSHGFTITGRVSAGL